MADFAGIILKVPDDRPYVIFKKLFRNEAKSINASKSLNASSINLSQGQVVFQQEESNDNKRRHIQGHQNI